MTVAFLTPGFCRRFVCLLSSQQQKVRQLESHIQSHFTPTTLTCPNRPKSPGMAPRGKRVAANQTAVLLHSPLPSQMIQTIGNKLDTLKAAGLDMIDYLCTFTGRVCGERTASDGTQSRLYAWEPAGIIEAQWLEKPEGGWAEEHVTRKLPLEDLPIAGRAVYLSAEGRVADDMASASQSAKRLWDLSVGRDNSSSDEG